MPKLTLQECRTLAGVLGDTPMSVISTSRLLMGPCNTYIAGTMEDFTAALVFDPYCPEEPCGFGIDAEALWDLLKAVDGWKCVNVDAACAVPLGEQIAAARGVEVRYYGDIYHTLLDPVQQHENRHVRRLRYGDMELLAGAPREVRGSGYGTAGAQIISGIAACAVIDDAIVSIAHTYAETALHTDIGAATLEKWRGNGFATAAASLVAEEIQEKGKVPVWSCGADNVASLRVAEKLGFTEVGRRVYVIPTPAEPADHAE